MTANVKRREFITLLGGATTWPLAARAQLGCGAIGLLMPPRPPRMAALFQELELLGWTVGRKVEIDVRLAARATAAVKNNSLCPEPPHPVTLPRE